jgi:hypothetical protein
MNKKKLFLGIGGLCVIASIGMYVVGSDSSHLSELVDFFWVPLPLGVVAILAGLGGKSK